MSKYYRGNPLRNPYFSKREKKHPWKRIIFLGLLSVIVIFGLLMFSTLFAITEIKVDGAKIISADEIREVAEQNISEHGRLLTVSTNKLKEELLKKFTFEKIEITKDFPRTLIITIEERIPVAVWQSNETAWLVDQTGKKIAEIPFGETRRSGLIYFFDESQTPVNENQIINPEKLKIALQVEEALRVTRSLEIPAIRLETAAGSSGKYVTSEGWELYIDLAGDIEAELLKLDAILRELGETRRGLQYIDIRFADRVYYQ